MTMMPGHPRWEQFLELLEGPQACDFTESTPGDASTATWICRHDFRFARTILEAWSEVALDASINYFAASGIRCDCEIIFNLGEDDA